MASIQYDGSKQALFRPEQRPTVLGSHPEPPLAALAVEAARLAYHRAEEDTDAYAQLSRDLGMAGFEPPTLLDDTGGGFGFLDGSTHSQGYATLRQSDGLALIAFRGTQADKIQDLVIDALAIRSDDTGWAGSVHVGFASAATGLWPQVEAWLTTTGASRRSLLMCGHSLGAAIATLIATRARPERLVTLGSPRVGNEAFASAFDALGLHTSRLVDGLDVVTRVPPRALGYRHVGQAVFIDRSGTVTESPADALVDTDPEPEQLLRLATSLFGDPPQDLSDHSPVNYLRGLWT